MLDDSNVRTFYSLRALSELYAGGAKPLVLWIGAGVSCWRGYPPWEHLAEIVNAIFSKSEAQYNRGKAIRLIDEEKFPDLFQLCKDTNERRYFSILTDALKPRKATPVWRRFIESLNAIPPLHILTTNVDESLDNSLEAIVTIQRSNLARSIELLGKRESFIVKLHGSISDVESAVFTSSDYRHLLNDQRYLELIKHIFTETVVLFVGYGLGDSYVLDLLSKAEQLKGIFGSTSHFAVVPTSIKRLPSFITPIDYLPIPHKDHRSAIQVVEEIGLAKYLEPRPSTEPTMNGITSSHFISDLLPPGRHETGTEYTCSDGSKLIQGFGVTDEELPSSITTSMHDLIVGLLCFDTVYAHLQSLVSLASLISQGSFETLLRNDCLRFVDWPYQQVIRFPAVDAENDGSLITLAIMDLNPAEQLKQNIRELLTPLPGKETEGQMTLDLVERKTQSITRDMEPDIPKTVRGLLLRPSIRRLLGMSGGTSSNRIPKWMVYPILRLTYMTKLGATCQTLGIASTKLDHGCDELAGPAFAAATGAEWADGMASYVLAQRFDTDLSGYSLANPSCLQAILTFRESREGIELRKEILEQLAIRQSSDFVTSINAGLRAVIPSRILQAAHDKLSGLLMAEGVFGNLTPALWTNPSFTNKATALWRRKSERTLKEYCNHHHIELYDPCPCGSGERLRFCCEESLTSVL